MLIGAEELHRLIEQLQQVRNRAIEDRTEVIKLYPSVRPKHDARINSLQLSLVFISWHLLDERWWCAIARKPIPDDDKKIYINEFINFVKIGFVMSRRSKGPMDSPKEPSGP